MKAPPDAEARQRAIQDTHLSMALSAGAGSGKTSVLVDRVVKLLLDGTPTERVAVITFTVKAAGELVERVRDALEKAYRTADDDARRVRLADIISGLPRLTLSTIHAFCADLLRSEALEASWAPGTAVLGEIYAPSAVEAGFASWRGGLARRRPDLLVRLLRDAEVAEPTLKKAALRLLEHRDLRPVPGRANPDFGPARADLDAIARDLLTTAAVCRNPACKLLHNNRALLDGLRALTPDVHPEAAVRRALALGKGSQSGGTGKDWPGDANERFKEHIDRLRDWRTATAPLAWEPLHGELVTDLTEHFLPRVDEAKSASAQVDFQDLLLLARDLLASRPAAARRLAARFDALLVDEVQDTDPLQSAIVMHLCRAEAPAPSPPAALAPWHTLAPRPGGLFAVGDPKQSIYRFRRADVAQWRRLHDAIASAGDAAHLEANFRSVPGLVDFVNAAFTTYPDYKPQRAIREPGALDPVVMLLPGSGTDDAVVRYLHHLFADGQVVDPGTRQARRPRWGDVMVLLPAWTRADEVHAALTGAGIPAVVEGGRRFFKRDEVRLCRAALQALEEPGHDEAVVLVLRGLFGISLEELARHRAAGGSWRYTARAQPPGPAADALATLALVARRRGQVSWVTLLDDVLEATAAPAVWSLLARGPSMLGNVDKLRAVVREIERHARSGTELLDRLQALEREEDEDLPLAGADADVVRISTYFKAKGLEAPIVILPHAARKDDPIDHVVVRERDELLLALGPLAPPGWAAAQANEKRERDAERRRWMYVAATRARDQLVIVRTDKPGLLEPDLVSVLPAIDTPDDTLVGVGDGVHVRVRRADALPPVPADQSTFPGHDAAVDALLSDPVTTPIDPGVSWRRSRRLRVAAAVRRGRAWTSVTELSGGGARRDSSARGGREDHEGEGREAGTAVHRAMQELDFALPPDARQAEARRLGRAFATEMGLSSRAIDKTAEVAARLSRHPIVERAAAAPEVWREVPFAVASDTRVVTGSIDLLFPTDRARTQWVVVDWKSMLPAPGDPRRAAYETQLEHYAHAVIETLGASASSIEKLLVGPHPELAELTPDAWDVALAGVAGDLGPLLEALRAAGVSAPTVGQHVGEPAIASDVELVWADRRIALAVDHDADELATLRAQGWTVVEWDGEDDAATTLARALDAALATVEEAL